MPEIRIRQSIADYAADRATDRAVTARRDQRAAALAGARQERARALRALADTADQAARACALVGRLTETGDDRETYATVSVVARGARDLWADTINADQAARRGPVDTDTDRAGYDTPAPSATIDQAATGEGWFVVALPAGPGTDQTQILAEGMSRDDAVTLADTTRRAMRLGGNGYGVVWECPTWSAVWSAERVASDLLDTAADTHRRDCGSIDDTGDYPDCSDRCDDASAVADDAVTRADQARHTLRHTLAGDLYRWASS